MGRRASAKVYEISNYNNKIKAKNPNQELYLTLAKTMYLLLVPLEQVKLY